MCLLRLETIIQWTFWIQTIDMPFLKVCQFINKGPFTLSVIPAVYRAVLRTCPISALLFISAWHPSGIALDRFQSDIPAVYRRPAVLLTNQRFCFAVVMPQPVTTLAGSDAYLGHQKQDVGEFNPSRPVSTGNTRMRRRSCSCGTWSGSPCIWQLASILSPLSPSQHQQKQQKILHFPPSIVGPTPPLSMTLCGDYGNETRSSTHLYLL